MKISTLLIASSLAVNAVLVGMLIVGSADLDTGARTRSTSDASAKKFTAKQTAAAGAETWTALSADDFAAQRDRLRDAGFPIEVIRAILGAQISESFAARRKAIENAQGETPFWKNPARDPKMQAALRDLYREQDKILKDLLGRDARSDDPTYTAYLHRQFGNLPDDKIDQLRQILDDYNQKRSDIYTAAGNGAILAEERQKLTDLDKAMRADYAAVMTPEELADYDLRSSNTAQQLRYNLAAFDPSEQEYRAIFGLQQAFDDKYGRMYGPLSQDEIKARSVAQKQLQDDITTALGPDRAAEYQRDTDYSYRQTSQLVARLELPPETATTLWNAQKEFEQRRNDIYSPGGAVSPADRTQQITALQQEAVTKVATLLGGDASRVDVYKQNGGQWLQSLMPRPAIPATGRK